MIELTAAQDNLLKEWRLLSEAEKSRLVPHLLVQTEDWRGRVFNDYSCLAWLGGKFKEAGLPFMGAENAPDLRVHGHHA